MKSNVFLGLFAAGMGAAALVVGAGCGGGTEATGGAGGEATTSSTTSSTSVSSSGTTSSSSTTSSSGTGGTGGTPSICPTTPDTALDIMVNDQTPTDCDLPDPSADGNYFKFTGTKGEVLAIFTTAKTGMDPFDPAFLDTVVTLYDANMTQIARNDDPTPRFSNDAQIFTILPANGDYIIEVQECNAVFGAASCSDVTKITELTYQLQVLDVSPNASSVSFGAEPNDDSTTASLLKYSMAASGGYFLSTLYGAFDTATDVDVYSFTLPADTTVSQGRALGNFNPFASGVDGDGSSVAVGKIWVVDPLDAAHKVAEVDASLGTAPGELSVPLTLDKQYFLFVTRPAGAVGASDFYFINHNGGGSNPVEAADATNNVATTAEALVDTADTGVLASYYVDGDIAMTGDIDFYSLVVPSGATTMSAVCGAQRSGSGLRNLKMSLLKADGTTLLSTGATITEAADTDALLQNIAIPTGTTKVIFKLQAGSQDPLVTSTFYRCAARMQ